MYVIDGRTAQVSIFTFGNCHVHSSGRLINPPFNLMRMLVYLLLEGNGKPVVRRRIGDLIWSDNGSEQANADIRQTVSRIRKFQDDNNFELMSADEKMAWLNLDQNIYIDLAEFMDIVAQPTPKGAVRLCEIYRGELLESLRSAGEGFEEWLAIQRTALRYEFISAVSQAIELDTDLTPHERHACATRLLQIDPYHEGAHRALMYDAAAKGQFSFVKQLFNDCSKRLREELGVGPDDETVRLYRELISRSPTA